ncbi:hypothetical protein [Cellulophaga sp. Hel_I_12]|uniref:hypothetical protein n=1 Tax=Cellulophaga sp. Hel_I_12 TaxID=1249972 RepID=UPI000647477C|nr:hypothetical protein [Cellulophaga sp. Hel_I_12]
MRNKNYSSFEEIDYDLKLLNLERKISIEELKGLKYDLQENLSPYSWLKTGLRLFGNFGKIMLLKKLFK